MTITFTHNNQQYTGEFTTVSGAASNTTYHLYVNGYYKGQLFKTVNGWNYYGNSFNEIKEVFEKWAGENII